MKLIVQKGDICKLEVDAVVVPANSRGEMGGGVAKAIKREGGEAIEKEAMAQAPIRVGEAVATGRPPQDEGGHSFAHHGKTGSAHRPGQSFPGHGRGPEAGREEKFPDPGPARDGHGVGKVPPAEAAIAMVEAVRPHWGKQLATVYLVDVDDEMVTAFQEAVKAPAK